MRDALQPSSSRSVSEQWLRSPEALDCDLAGVPHFPGWDPAVAVVARIVEFSPTAMALLMGCEGVLFANSAAKKLILKDLGEENGQSIFRIMPESAAFYASALKDIFQGVSQKFLQTPIRSSNSAAAHNGWFDLDFTPVCNREGSIVGALLTINDVTDQVQRLKDLSEISRRFNSAIESSEVIGVWTLDVATNKTTSDENVARMFGFQSEVRSPGIDDACFLTAIYPEDRPRVQAELSAAIASGRSYRSRYRIIAADGRVHWLITSAEPVLNNSGDVEQLLGIVVDATDQVEAASALAESRFQFQTLTEALPQIVWSCDGEGRHDYFSGRWSEFTGIEQQDITEETWKNLVYPEHQAMVASVWANALRTGETYDIDYRFRHRSGEYRWLRVMALPIRDESGAITRWFGTSTDVHDAYLLAQEREDLAREMERIAAEDQLTETLTRRAFVDRLGKELQQRADEQPTFSLLMLDIDHFKSINDRYGHPVGDKVLVATAKLTASEIRKHDFIGRLGGEEFAVFLPNCSPAQAMNIAERIRKAIADNPVALTDGRQINVTTSIGAACARLGSAEADEILAAADRALYQSKEGGRNRSSLVGI